MTDTDAQPARPLNTRAAARAAGLLAALVGLVVLAAWFLDLAPRSALPGFFAMKANTALAFVLLGTSLHLAAAGVGAASRERRRVLEGCAGAAALVGLLTLIEYVSGRQLGIDQLLLRDASGTAFPGRMAPQTALNFALLGVALLWQADARRDPRPARILALAAIFVAFLALVGYAYEYEPLYGSGSDPRMAVHTALAFCALCAGIFLLRPDKGFMAVVLSDSTGGIIARRLLPVTIVAPVALGWLRLVGQRAGLYGPDLGLSMFVVCNVGLLIAVVGWTAGSLHRADRVRRRTEEALAASEVRYRQLTEASLDPIVVADVDGRITLFNPAAERAFGYAAGEVLAQPLTCLMPPEFHERHRQGLRHFVETREPRLVGRTVEVPGRRKDGTDFPLELSLGALEVEGRLQFVGSIRDLTERHRMRATMIQSEKLASIGLLSAGVAHEINNPLAYVANNLAVLERDARNVMSVLDAYEGARDLLAAADPAAAAHIRELAEKMDLPYVRANLDRILGSTRQGVERVTRIVQAMRGMARTGPAQTETIRPADLIDMSLELVRGRISRRGIAVELDCADAPRLRCAASPLAQVLLNLVVNALQAVEARRPEGGRIRIASRAVGQEVLIEVADNGGGIPAQDLPRVFDPFFTTKELGEGTGLGLSISHGIVTAHGGRMEASSELGTGSCFRVFLPLRDSGGAA